MPITVCTMKNQKEVWVGVGLVDEWDSILPITTAVTYTDSFSSLRGGLSETILKITALTFVPSFCVPKNSWVIWVVRFLRSTGSIYVAVEGWAVATILLCWGQKSPSSCSFYAETLWHLSGIEQLHWNISIEQLHLFPCKMEVKIGMKIKLWSKWLCNL